MSNASKDIASAKLQFCLLHLTRNDDKSVPKEFVKNSTNKTCSLVFHSKSCILNFRNLFKSAPRYGYHPTPLETKCVFLKWGHQSYKPVIAKIYQSSIYFVNQIPTIGLGIPSAKCSQFPTYNEKRGDNPVTDGLFSHSV